MRPERRDFLERIYAMNQKELTVVAAEDMALPEYVPKLYGDYCCVEMPEGETLSKAMAELLSDVITELLDAYTDGDLAVVIRPNDDDLTPEHKGELTVAYKFGYKKLNEFKKTHTMKWEAIQDEEGKWTYKAVWQKKEEA